MTPLFATLMGISFAGLFGLAIRTFMLNKNLLNLMVHLTVLLMAMTLVTWIFGIRSYSSVGSNDLLLSAALYFTVILGMAASQGYNHFSLNGNRIHSFDWNIFATTLLASSLIFIPLLVSFQEAGIDLYDVHTTRLVLFVVAFQNGFFWKEYLERRKKLAAEHKFGVIF